MEIAVTQLEEFTKPWWRSRAVWGAVVAILAALAGLFGKAISAEQQAEAVNLLMQAIDLFAVAGGVGGGALALWGRLRATAVISKK